LLLSSAFIPCLWFAFSFLYVSLVENENILSGVELSHPIKQACSLSPLGWFYWLVKNSVQMEEKVLHIPCLYLYTLMLSKKKNTLLSPLSPEYNLVC
jgi:hypothetical protein